MSCEICGRNSCSRVFNSLESQNEFDEVADKVKDRIKAELKHNVNRLNYEEINGKIYVELEEVENLIDDAG